MVFRYFGSLAHNKVHQEVIHFAMAGCVLVNMPFLTIPHISTLLLWVEVSAKQLKVDQN